MAVDHRVETLALLRSIDASLKQLVARSQPVVNDRVCDGPRGDPVMNAKDPRDWSGETMVGRHFSECPALYLDLLAARYDYFATREDDPKKRHYDELDAQRARGWAARIRAGYVAPTRETSAPNPEPSW